MTGEEVQVQRTCQVTFAISDDYKDTIWCNVLLMDSGDILLDQSWMYDKEVTQGMSDHTYMFHNGGKQVTPSKETRTIDKKSKRKCPKGSASRTPCLYRQ